MFEQVEQDEALEQSKARENACWTIIADKQAEIERLRAENFSLAAGQCIVDGGLVGDEGGTPYCSLQKKVDRLRAELADLRAKLCAVGIVGSIDGHDVIRRQSVLDLAKAAIIRCDGVD